MPTTRAETPQLAIPLRFTPDGREALVEQGTLEELTQHAVVGARILRGSLDADPSFGTSDQTGREGGINTDQFAAELTSCDPRVEPVIDQVMDGAEAIVDTRIREARGG